MEHPPISVLIADRHVVFRNAMAIVLQQKYDVTAYGSMDELLSAVQTMKPSIVIIDLVLSTEDNSVVFNTIKTDFPEVKTIMMVFGREGNEFVSELEKTGVDGYFPKNSDVAEMLAAVDEVYTNRFDFGRTFLPIQKK